MSAATLYLDSLLERTVDMPEQGAGEEPLVGHVRVTRKDDAAHLGCPPAEYTPSDVRSYVLFDELRKAVEVRRCLRRSELAAQFGPFYAREFGRDEPDAMRVARACTAAPGEIELGLLLASGLRGGAMGRC